MSFNPYINKKTSDGLSNPCDPKCKERSHTCHGSCGKYKKYEKALKKDNEQRQTSRAAWFASMRGIEKNRDMRAKKHYGY